MSHAHAARRCAAVLVLLLVWPVRPAHATDVTVGDETVRLEATSTTIGGWHTGNPKYGELFERLNLGAGVEAWQVGLRVDTATFARPPTDVQDRYELEKAWITWTARSLEVSAGDSYISFGRGLALSLRKVDELGIDTTLRGVKLLAHADDFGGTVAAGYTNINNVDEASGKSLDDPRDVIVAARIEGGSSGIILGMHGSAVFFREPLGLVPEKDYRDRYYQVGATIDAPHLTDWLGFYFEAMGQERRAATDPDRSPAFGFYGSTTLYLGPATVLLEGKAYGDIEPIKPRVDRPEFSAIAYNNPPTVERLLQIIENPQKEIEGGRVRLDWNFSPSFVAYANYGLFRDSLGYADPQAVGEIRPAVIHDPYAGIELRAPDGQSWLLASGGQRPTFLDSSHTVVREDAHLEADGALALGGPWSATLHSFLDWRKKYESRVLDYRYREGTILLGVRLNPWAGLGAGYDYTTDPTQPKRDYWNGQAEWDITRSSSVRLFVGGTRGGLRCVSGVCRVFPPFEGFKLSVTLRL